MNQNNDTNTSSSSSTHQPATVARTVAELAVTWATYGLEVGRLALEASAHTLDKTAKALEMLRRDLANEPEPIDATVEPQPAVIVDERGAA